VSELRSANALIRLDEGVNGNDGTVHGAIASGQRAAADLLSCDGSGRRTTTERWSYTSYGPSFEGRRDLAVGNDRGGTAIFDPSGEFLITAQDNGVGVYKVGHDSLTEIRSSPFGGVGMDRVIFTPLGRFIAAISRSTGQIFVFAFDRRTGTLALAPGSPVPTSSPYDLAVIQH
jgi:hypothetical protein